MNDGASFDANIRLGMFEAACDILAAGVIVYDKNDCLVFASRQVLRYFPIKPDFLKPGTRLRDVLGAIFDTGLRYGISPETRNKAVNREEWISTRISVHWREQHDSVERLGRDRWVHFRKRRLPNGCNISTLTDVSEQKKQEEQWRSDVERIGLTEEILETLPCPLMIKDRSLSYVAVNKAFCAIHGTSSESVLGRSVWDLVDVDNAERIETSDRAVLETGTPSALREHILRVDGSHLYVITRKYRIGTPGRYFLVTFMEDVTDLTVLDAQANDSGGLVLRPLEDFVESQNYFDPLRDAEKRLLMEQIRPEEMRGLEGKRVLVATPSLRVEALLLEELRACGVECCAVRSDVEHDAFLDMAAAHGVAVDLVLVDENLPGHQAILDNGRGIETRLVAADGIGSEIMRALNEEHDLLSEDETPLGDIVNPAALSDDWYIATDIDALMPGGAGDIDVLVAEDNQINQFVFSQILEGMGISHRIAENGEEAVSLWRKHQPRLVLMDISMPVKNGLDATIEIREAERTLGLHTPIVAVTAQALNVDMQNCMDAGMDDYITKPVSPDMIEAIYRRYVTETASKSAG